MARRTSVETVEGRLIVVPGINWPKRKPGREFQEFARKLQLQMIQAAIEGLIIPQFQFGPKHMKMLRFLFNMRPKEKV